MSGERFLVDSPGEHLTLSTSLNLIVAGVCNWPAHLGDVRTLHKFIILLEILGHDIKLCRKFQM